MKQLTKDKVEEFLEYYHNFHDGIIKSVIYDCDQARIKVIIEASWIGEVEVNREGKYNNKKKNVKVVFSGVENANIKEMFSWDFIMEAYLKYINMNNKEYICFADNDTSPNFYCVCEKLEYEEIS